MRRRLLATCACWALAGCAVGPDFHTPAPPQAQTYGASPAPAAVAGQRLVPGGSPAADWWRGFGSPELDRLMATALAHNADLAAARAALRQARETWLAQRGALLPTADLAAQAQRARGSQSIAPVLNANIFTYNLYTTQVNVGYTLDLFGGVRRSVEAARAQAEQQQFESEAAYLTLTSNVATAYLQLAALRDQLRIDEQLVDVAGRLVALTRLQHQTGQVSAAELAQAEATLAQARNALPGLKKQIAQQVDLLAALCGETPSELGEPPGQLAELRLPADLPVSLPAQMVRQRPDVRAAEAAVHAASAQLGVAIANRLPNITLSGAAGGAAPQIGAVLTQPNQLWSISGAIAQPLFRGGQLLHQQRAAKAALDEAQAQYRSAVLAGFQNVADALAAVANDAEGFDTARAAETAAQKGASIAALRHRVGDVSEVDELNASVTALQASLARSQAQAARLGDSVALFVALGGGWWERRDFDAAVTTAKAAS
jgi:NodT family efflux transporter outer membrane factor (OMF) lipoprotein